MPIFILLLALLLPLSAQAKLTDGLYANIQTNRGDIIVKLTMDKTPLTVINFVALAQGNKDNTIKQNEPFYDGLKFHRVINNFMIQGGDPHGTGAGGPGYQFADEITDLKHDKAGVLSMANSGANTNGSQFFITHKATPWLNGKHTVFGQVVEGMNVVNSIKKDDTINKVKIIRIGDKANNFKTDEESFQQHNKKYSTNAFKTSKKNKLNLAEFVSANYKSALLANKGHYYQINKSGDVNSTSPKNGALITTNLAIKLANGKVILAKNDNPFKFQLGDKTIIPLLNDAILSMKTGEERTIIASYNQVYGNAKLDGLNADDVMIFTINLLTIGVDSKQ